MGPRPFGRGRTVPASPKTRSSERFNGAATFRSRKDVGGARWAHTHWSLQWGRDLSVAEGLRIIKKDDPEFLLQWGRDLSVAEGVLTPSPSRRLVRFNGAATFRSRKGLGRGRRHGFFRASMGPRPFGRGRIQKLAGTSTVLKLQWGRDLSVAEGTYIAPSAADTARSFNGAATFRSRKVDGAGHGSRPWPVASMGPRPFGRGRCPKTCGKTKEKMRFNGAATFRSRKEEARP